MSVKHFIIAGLLLVSMHSLATPAENEHQVQIPLVVFYDNTHGLGNIMPKSPVQPPLVFLDGQSLYFGESYSEAVPVELTDATGNVVYSDYLPAGTQTLSLPATLSGTYTLFIYIGNYVFAGLINL